MWFPYTEYLYVSFQRFKWPFYSRISSLEFKVSFQHPTSITAAYPTGMMVWGTFTYWRVIKYTLFGWKKNSIILVFISLGFYKCMMPIKEYFNRDNYLCLWFLHSGGIFSCSECFSLHLLQRLQWEWPCESWWWSQTLSLLLLSRLSRSPSLSSPLPRSLTPMPLDKLTGLEWKLCEDDDSFSSKVFFKSLFGLQSHWRLNEETLWFVAMTLNSLLCKVEGESFWHFSLTSFDGHISKSSFLSWGNIFVRINPYVLSMIIARIQNEMDNNEPATMAGTNMYNFKPTWNMKNIIKTMDKSLKVRY